MVNMQTMITMLKRITLPKEVNASIYLICLSDVNML